MSRPVMFNGRLNKNELDIWLDLFKETSDTGFRDRYIARQFLALPESISFVSSIENQIIGGTSIYKDRTRLSMVLVSVAVKDSFRESTAHQIIKSSLPFFKTVAIRDVDVLVAQNESGSSDKIGFPLSLEVDQWVRGAIKNIGFDEVAKIGQYSFECLEKKSSFIGWDEQPNIEGAKELIWDQGKPLGLTNSLVWVARDFAANRGNLVTSTIDGKAIVVAGLWKIENTLVVSPLVTDPEVLGWSEAAKGIISEGSRINAKEIQIPIIGEGQIGLVEELERRTNVETSRELSLLRKPL
ncbi:MAG: hypothetical protein ACFFE3_07830 [Candidatus Thorarchaeota archaeon]